VKLLMKTFTTEARRSHRDSEKYKTNVRRY
jgi:hypothetical protein